MTLNQAQWPAWEQPGVRAMPIEEARRYQDVDVAHDAWESPKYMENLQREIQDEGLQHPLVLQRNQRAGYGGGEHKIWDGNHRLVVLDRMGSKSVPVRDTQPDTEPLSTINKEYR